MPIRPSSPISLKISRSVFLPDMLGDARSKLVLGIARAGVTDHALVFGELLVEHETDRPTGHSPGPSCPGLGAHAHGNSFRHHNYLHQALRRLVLADQLQECSLETNLDAGNRTVPCNRCADEVGAGSRLTPRSRRICAPTPTSRQCLLRSASADFCSRWAPPEPPAGAVAQNRTAAAGRFGEHAPRRQMHATWVPKQIPGRIIRACREPGQHGLAVAVPL